MRELLKDPRITGQARRELEQAALDAEQFAEDQRRRFQMEEELIKRRQEERLRQDTEALARLAATAPPSGQQPPMYAFPVSKPQ